VLAGGCLVLGICAPLVLRTMQPIVALLGPVTTSVSSVWHLPMAAFILTGLVTILAAKLWMDYASHRMPIRTFITWECGFGALGPRAQVSGMSFAQPIAHMFSVLYRYAQSLESEGGLFPAEFKSVTTSKSVLEAGIYRPAARFFSDLGDKILWLQEGSIHRYLGTMLITLVILLVIGGYVRN
jgi:hydrogenase-4 component B